MPLVAPRTTRAAATVSSRMANPPTRDRATAITRAITRMLEGAIGVILAVMAVLVFGNVVLRYGFNSGIAVSEELARYLFIWLTFIGAAVALHEHAHLGVDALVRALSPAGQRVCAVVADLAMLAIVAILFKGSWTQVQINMATRSPVSEVPLAVIYVAGLAASTLMGLAVLRHLLRALRGEARGDELVLTGTEDAAAASPGPAARAAHAHPPEPRRE